MARGKGQKEKNSVPIPVIGRERITEIISGRQSHMQGAARYNRKNSYGEMIDAMPDVANLYISTGVPLTGSTDIYRNLELPGGKKQQPSLLNYNKDAQLVLNLGLDVNGDIGVRGVELYEKEPLITSRGTERICTQKIVGEKTSNLVIAMNPLQIVQGHGVVTDTQAVKNGAYGFGNDFSPIDSADMQDFAVQKSGLGQSGIIPGVSPFEISLLMEKEDALASLMRNNPGFIQTQEGQAAIVKYLQKEIDNYKEINMDKHVDTVLARDEARIIADKRQSDFNDVMESQAWKAASTENYNQLAYSLAQYKVSTYADIFEKNKHLDPIESARAHEEMQYYSRYLEFAELSSQWNDKMVQPLMNSYQFTEDEKKQRLSYLSVQNGYSPEHFNQLRQAFDTLTVNMKKELAITNNENETTMTPARLAVYSGQLEHISKMIRAHPENPLNKPLLPIESTIDPDIQKVDSVLMARMNAFNNSDMVRDDSNLELSANILSSQQRCRDFIQQYKDHPGMEEGVSIAQRAIYENAYHLSHKSYNSFVTRQNEQRILEAVRLTVDNLKDGEKVPFTHEELLAASRTPEELKTLISGRMGINYSAINMQDFFSSQELQAAIRDPEKLIDNNFGKSPLIFDSDDKLRPVTDLQDPVKCQEIKSLLISKLDEVRKENEAAGSVKYSTKTIEDDLNFVDSVIIENRQRLNQEQRLMNNYNFDNLTAIHLTDDDIDIIKSDIHLDSSNVERYHDPSYVYAQLKETSFWIERLETRRLETERGPAPKDEEELAKWKGQITRDAQQAVDKSTEVQFLRSLLNSDVKYEASLVPRAEREKDDLINRMILYAREKGNAFVETNTVVAPDNPAEPVPVNTEHNPTLITENELYAKFGDHPKYDEAMEQLRTSVEEFRLADERLICVNTDDVLDRFDAYNRLVECQGSDIPPSLFNNKYAQDYLRDENFYAQFEAGELKPIKEPELEHRPLNYFNAEDCRIFIQTLSESDNPYAQEIAKDMSTPASYMGNCDVPSSVLERIHLKNDMIEFARDGHKRVSLDELREQFGDNPQFDTVTAQLSDVIRNHKLAKQPIECATSEELMEKIDTYNRFVDCQDIAISKVDWQLKEDTYAQEFVLDNEFVELFEHDGLKRIEVPPYGMDNFDASDPMHCRILLDSLKSSDDVYVQQFARELEASMEYMENSAMHRSIIHNCQTVLETRDLTPEEASALQNAAKEKLEVCLLRDIEAGSLEPGDFNLTLENLHDEVDMMFTPEAMAANRQANIDSHMESALRDATEIEDSFRTLYTLKHPELKTSLEGPDGPIEMVSSADIIARAQMRQITSDPQHAFEGENAINERLHQNKYFIEHQKQYDIRDKISSIDEQIERIKNPPDLVDIDTLRGIVERNEPGMFTSKSKREAWEFEKEGLENRERIIAQLEEQKAQYMEQLAREDALLVLNTERSHLDSELILHFDAQGNLADAMEEYRQAVIEPKLAEAQTLVDAYHVEEDLKRDEFAKARLDSMRQEVDGHQRVDEKICERYEKLMQDPQAYDELKRLVLKYPEGVSESDQEAVRLLSETYSSFVSREGQVQAERELASVQSDWNSAKEFECLYNIQYYSEQFQAKTIGLSSQELEQRMDFSFGECKADYITIAGDDIARGLKSGLDTEALDKNIQYLNAQQDYIVILNDKLAASDGSPGVLSAQEEQGLKEYLRVYDEYEKAAGSPEIEAARIKAEGITKEDFFSREPVISSDGVDERTITNADLVAAVAAPINLPENVNQYYEEHKEEFLIENKPPEKDASDLAHEEDEKDDLDHIHEPDRDGPNIDDDNIFE